MKNFVEDRELVAADSECVPATEECAPAEAPVVETRQVATPVAEMFVSSY
jgi:hypothetical protein